MTIPITDAVTVTITRQTLFPQGPGFGVALIVVTDTGAPFALAERIRVYSSLASLSVDFASDKEPYKAAAAILSQNPNVTQIAVGLRDNLEPTTLGDEMDAIAEINNDWYAFLLTAEGRISVSANLADEAALWAEAQGTSNPKLFVTASNEASMITAGGGQAGVFATAGYNRSGTWYHPDADAVSSIYPEAAFLGQMLTVDFNGFNTVKTGKFKPLSSIPVTGINVNELAFLHANFGNGYARVAGTAMNLDGTMASGEYFDIMHGVDWLSSEIAFRVFGKLATAPRIPYTSQGVAILAGEVEGALAQGVRNGFLSSQIQDDDTVLAAYEITAGSVLDVSEANRAARIAPPISFVARVSGAVHHSTINGIVTI